MHSPSEGMFGTLEDQPQELSPALESEREEKEVDKEDSPALNDSKGSENKEKSNNFEENKEQEKSQSNHPDPEV